MPKSEFSNLTKEVKAFPLVYLKTKLSKKVKEFNEFVVRKDLHNYDPDTLYTKTDISKSTLDSAASKIKLKSDEAQSVDKFNFACRKIPIQFMETFAKKYCFDA